jgi:hypothetical protein
MQFRATIDQSWFSTKIIFETDTQSILKKSNSLAVELLRGSDTEGKRLIVTFKQQNSLPRVPTDEQEFLGTALFMVSEDGLLLEGAYWNNRTWDRGLNTAGVIRMRRIAS